MSLMSQSKQFFIYTMGCQMNVVDTGQMETILLSMGYKKAATYASADIVLANTCAIREKAEEKAFSFLGRLSKLKKKNPGLIVGIGGCVAQQEGMKILSRMPHVDMVFGTDAIGRLPDLIRAVTLEATRVVDIQPADQVFEPEGVKDQTPTPEISRFVTIMQGCDNFCTYCVVPHVRGREKSRDPGRILNEIRALTESGVREITLLGQNVNSYGKKEGLCSFVELLQKINGMEDLMRIRFTTSHPKDLSAELIDAYGRLDKLCRHIHLPVQSGSTEILRRMNRRYSRSQYLEKIDRLRNTCHDMALSTDIIVGFPGETEKDFSDTLNLIKHVEYDSLFVFNYSDRPKVPAASFDGKIPKSIQNERLQAVLDLQESITAKKNEAMVGGILEVLVEGKSKKQHRQAGVPDAGGDQWSGRTTSNRIVNFTSDPNGLAGAGSLRGKIVRVGIERALAHSLWGRMVEPSSTSEGMKGEKHYAA
jgi:tRNA-2-methylthio-N6-dimethylallyladenosine synthase